MGWTLDQFSALTSICDVDQPQGCNHDIGGTFRPGSSLHHSALQAFDSSVFLLSQGGGERGRRAPEAHANNDEEDDDDGMPEHTPHVALARASSARAVTRVPHQARRGAGPSRVAPRRKRITPFQAKRVAARQQWKCAMCVANGVKDGSEFLQEDFEVDHIVPLHRGGSFDNDIDSLQCLHKRCHLLKNSIEQRQS